MPFFIILTLCCVVLLSGPVWADDTLEVIDRGLGLLSSGDVDAARQALAPVIGVETPDPTALSARGILELLASQPGVAEVAFRRALDQDPRHITVLWGLSLSLLARNRVFEATTMIDRAAVVAPDEPHIKTLQAYVYLLLGRYADATAAGKTALDSGDQSAFLMATLAQIHYNLGYNQKALLFAQRASQFYHGMDFLAPRQQITLPLTMIIMDTPEALSASDTENPPATVKGNDLQLDLPGAKAETDTGKQAPLQIIAPREGSTVHGLQRVRAAYRGNREIKFVVFLVDKVMRGMITELPYHFNWDADTVAAGEHQLAIRAYDYRGVVIEEDTITVKTQAGEKQPVQQTSERELQLEKRMIALSVPVPAPMSLFQQMGFWYRDQGENAKAISAFEKAASLDAVTEGVIDALAQLYQGNGLHPLTPGGEITHGPGNGKLVALTFDDGPNPLYTPNILAELKRYNAHSTFFMVGKMAQQYPDLVLQTMADGHELANHTYTHPNLTKLDQKEIISEVLRARTVIKEITGRQTYLFRPPGGDIDPFVVKQLRSLDYNIIYWDINAGEMVNFPPPQQAAQIMKKVQPGSIILLHNGPVDGTLNILDFLLADLTRQGYTCVTVSELMSSGPMPAEKSERPLVGHKEN
jgi:peptidoglycan/xylan/chitin deacetylase (PgdA/CDA1 family)